MSFSQIIQKQTENLFIFSLIPSLNIVSTWRAEVFFVVHFIYCKALWAFYNGKALYKCQNVCMCPNCPLEIETEFQFITTCLSFNNREKIFNSIYVILPSFRNMSEADKFMFIMQSSDYDISKNWITNISNMYNDRRGDTHIIFDITICKPLTGRAW